jgi:hypothetical protein
MAEAITIRAAAPSDAPILSELLAQLGYPATVTEIPARLSAVPTHEFYEKRDYENTGLRFTKKLAPDGH